MSTISSEKLQTGGGVSFSPDGRFLISSHVLLKNLATESWDTTAGTLVRGNNDASLHDRGKPFFSPDGRFRAAPFSPMKDLYDPSAGSLLNPFTNGYKDVYKQRIDLYDGASDKRLRELDGWKAPDTGIIPAAGFSFDGKLLAMTGFEKKERLLIYEEDGGRSTLSDHDDEQAGR
jgi:hypothetical protein